MTWYSLEASGANRHFWLRSTTDGADRLTDVTLPDGRELRQALRQDGPEGLGVWFEQMPETGGTTMTDMLWDTSACGIKIVSERLAKVLLSCDHTLTQQAVDLRDRRGAAIGGYLILMDRIGEETPVHSFKRRARGDAFVVSGDVRQAVRNGSFRGLNMESVDTPFPGDEPL